MSYGDYPNLKNIRKILVVKLRHLGDVLLTGPVFTALKKAIPEAKIDAFVWSESKPMLEGHPALSELLVYERSWKKGGWLQRLKREIALFWQIRKKGYDLVINLTEGDRGALAARISGARIRVGFDPKGRGFFGKKKLYTHVAKNCPSLRHTVERNLDALRRIGIFPSFEERDLFLHISEEVKRSIQELVGSAPYILIHPTSRWRFKCWPISRVRELTRRLVERGERVVFSSGPDPIETGMVAEIAQELPVVNLAGKLTLKQLAALIEGAKTLICVDSVPLHMASALKAPVIALFGPTSEITWGPWRNPRAQILTEDLSCRPCYQDGCGGSKKSDCLERISVEKVLRSL